MSAPKARGSLVGLLTLISYITMVSRGFAIIDPHHMHFGDCQDFMDHHHAAGAHHHMANQDHIDHAVIETLHEIDHAHPPGHGTGADHMDERHAFADSRFHTDREFFPNLLSFTGSRWYGPLKLVEFCRDGEFLFPDPKTSSRHFERYASAFRDYLQRHGIDPELTLTSTGISLNPPPVTDELAMDAWQEEVLNKTLSQLDCENPNEWDLSSLGIEVARYRPQPLTPWTQEPNEQFWRAYRSYASTHSYKRPLSFPWGWMVAGAAGLGLISLFSDDDEAAD